MYFSETKSEMETCQFNKYYMAIVLEALQFILSVQLFFIFNCD